MARNEHICGNCEHHLNKEGEWICANRDSDLYGLETGYEDSCLDFEEREHDKS